MISPTLDALRAPVRFWLRWRSPEGPAGWMTLWTAPRTVKGICRVPDRGRAPKATGWTRGKAAGLGGAPRGFGEASEPVAVGEAQEIPVGIEQAPPLKLF